MEIDITEMIENKDDMCMLSGSVMELGCTAGEVTWRNSKAYAANHVYLKTSEEIQEAKDYFGAFGAWDDEEREAWSDKEVNALLIQYIAGDMREMEGYETEEEYFADQIECTVSSNIFKTEDGRYFFSLSH